MSLCQSQCFLDIFKDFFDLIVILVVTTRPCRHRASCIAGLSIQPTAFLSQLVTGQLDKISQNIGQHFWIRLTQGQHLATRLLAAIPCVPFQKHWCHLQTFIENQFTFTEASQLNNHQGVVVSNLPTVRVRQGSNSFLVA